MFKKADQSPEPGQVYLVQAVGTNRYKIGYSSDLGRRIRTLNGSQSPYPLDLIGFSGFCRDVDLAERKVHQMFEDKRVHGEWFDLSSVEVDLVLHCFIPKPERPGTSNWLKAVGTVRSTPGMPNPDIKNVCARFESNKHLLRFYALVYMRNSGLGAFSCLEVFAAGLLALPQLLFCQFTDLINFKAFGGFSRWLKNS